MKKHFSLNAWKIQCFALEFPTFENFFFLREEGDLKKNRQCTFEL